MEGNYPVYFGTRQVGKVQVTHQGLYYRFNCRCQLTGDVICRLFVSSGDHRESLGVVVPVGNGFGLDTKVAAKRLGEGKLSFSLHPKHETAEGKFVPIIPEEPFAYLSRLKDAYLEKREEQMGAVIPGEN